MTNWPSPHQTSSDFSNPPYYIRRTMKIRSRAVCQSCRKRKYGCDGKRPACTQCLKAKKTCPGYEDFTFVLANPSSSKNPPSKAAPKDLPSQAASMLPSRSSAQCLMLNFSTFWWSTEEDVVALVIEYFTPEHHGSWQDLRPDKSSPTICSPWLEALPLLLDRSRRTSRNAPLLSASLRTLGYSIVCKGYEDSTRSQWDICRAEYYAKAAQSLNRELTEGTGVCDESAAAIMCLIMAELLIPTSREGWIAHVRGIGRMMELCGPRSFTKPISQQLFMAFCPLIIVEACLSRQDTFLSSYEWQTIPFSLHEAPPFQMLLGHGSVLPSLLRKLQSLHLFSDEVKGSMAQNILTGLLTTLQELEAWEHSMQSAVQGPLFWPRAACPTQQTVNDSVQLSLWFSSLPVATSLSYLWAFRAVCYKQIAHLLSSDLAPPSCRDRALACLNLPGIKDCQKKSLAFHSMICQSIPYFMQYEMKFYGAASVTLPLMLTQMVL